jgi:hypothetical protein
MIDGVSVGFDENAVTDLQVLCYYAYSPLYTGSDVVRSGELGSTVCGGSGHVTWTLNQHTSNPFDGFGGPRQLDIFGTLTLDAQAHLAADGSVVVTASGSYARSDSYTSAADQEVCFVTSDTTTEIGSVTGAVFDGFGTLMITVPLTGSRTVVFSVPSALGGGVTTFQETNFIYLPAQPIVAGGRIVALDLNSNNTSYGYATIVTGMIPVAAGP